MLSIVYTSRARDAFTDEDLDALLGQSRANNDRLDLSGMLLFREGRFLQILEGPDDDLRRKMAAISGDPRHTDVTVLLDEPVDSRFFGRWTMRYESVDDQDAAELPDDATDFERLAGEVSSGDTSALRELIRWFQEKPAA